MFSDYLVNDWLNLVFGSGGNPAPTSRHLSLHNADPGEGGVAEFNAGGYAREAITWGAPSAGANNRQQTQNTSQADFTNLQASNTPIDWWGVFDAATAGNFLARSNQTNQIIQDGDNATAGVGALSLLAG